MQFWNDLSDRERWVVVAGASVLVLGTMFLLLWTPISTWKENAAISARTAERDYELVKEAAMRRPASSASDEFDATTPTRNAILQSSEQAGVSLQFVNTLDDGSVTANASGVAPEQLYRWISVLEQSFGIAVSRADVAREADNPEALRVQLTLTRTS